MTQTFYSNDDTIAEINSLEDLVKAYQAIALSVKGLACAKYPYREAKKKKGFKNRFLSEDIEPTD